ncbi:MAG: VOC family protein [Bacteroidota bacterium]
MKEITKIKESCLYINDLEEAKAFYHGKLGFDVISYLPDKHIFFRVGLSVLLCFNPEDSRLKTSPPPHFAKGNQHFAFEVDPSDYEKVKQKIVDKGIEITDTVIWSTGQESFYFNDYEQNVMEIVPLGVWK